MDDAALSGRYLGQLIEMRDPEEGSRYGVIVPAYEAATDGSVWATPLVKPKKALSDSGYVLWRDLPADVSVGTYWNFSVRLSPTFDPPSQRERYEVVDSTPAIEALDLWRRWTEIQIRERLTGEGAFLKSSPLGSPVMIWYAKDQWLGPVTLERAVRPGMWRIADGVELRGLEVYHPPAAVRKPIEVAGQGRHLVLPSGNLGEWIKSADWTPDHLLVARLLQRIGELGGNTHDALAINAALLRHYQDTLKAAGLIGADLRTELGTAERVREMGAMMASNGSLLKEAAAVFQNVPEVRAQVEEYTRELYDKIKREQSISVELEILEARSELDVVREELRQCAAQVAAGQTELSENAHAITAGVDRLEAIRKELEGKEAELDTAREDFRRKLRERLRDLINSPEALFGEYATIRAILGRVDEAKIFPAAEPSGATTSVDRGERNESGVEAVTTQKEAVASLGQAVRARRFSPNLGIHLAAAFVSGATPVVAGPRAFDALSAFATVVTGGRLTWIPVGATTLEPRDLLGSMVPGTRAFLPHPGGLLDVLLDAEQSDALHLVVFEGFDRAPIDSYLQPLLECRVDGWNGSALRTIPVAPRNAVPEGDPHFGVGRVRWPSNVLLALIPVAGSTSFPLPRSLWQHAVMIDTGSSLYRTESKSAARPIPRTEIATSIWSKWRQGVLHRAEDDSGSPGIRDAYGCEPEIIAVATSAQAAARTLNLSEQSSFAFAARASLLPAIVSSAGDITGFTEAVEISEPDLERIRLLLTADRR